MKPPAAEPPISQLTVIGIGLDGWLGLGEAAQKYLQNADILIGSDRQLDLIPETESTAERWILGNIPSTLAQLRKHLDTNAVKVGILATGDPLFFGIGRLILEKFPTDWVTVLPNISSVQLAFSAIKQPWQDAAIISLHGRSPDELIKAIRRGDRQIALLTDQIYTPGAIATLIEQWMPAEGYRLWLCENLGGPDEAIRSWSLRPGPEQKEVRSLTVSPLNIVILQRQDKALEASKVLPIFGIADGEFLGFRDRPGLITKREIRILILGMLQLQRDHIVWDIGAGTGSVAIEIGRLCPEGNVYAIEKTAAGIELIHKNTQRFSCSKSRVTIVSGEAPEALESIPAPHRIFIGGSGGELRKILDFSLKKLLPGGRIVIALATIERTQELQTWHQKTQETLSLKEKILSLEWTQINIARSVPVGPLTRWSPLNPVTLAILEWQCSS